MSPYMTVSDNSIIFGTTARTASRAGLGLMAISCSCDWIGGMVMDHARLAKAAEPAQRARPSGKEKATMPDKVRVGIVGASPTRGFASISHIPALQALPDFQIIAVCTSSQASADAAAKHYGA